MSAALAKTLKALLAPRQLKRGDGDYEIGQEVLKRDLKDSIEAMTGHTL